MRNDGVCSQQETTWGRTKNPSSVARLTMLTIFLSAPLVCLLFTVTNVKYGGSFSAFIQEFKWEDFYVPWVDLVFVAKVITFWIFVQWLYSLLPDMCSGWLPNYVGGFQKGATTPAGHTLTYNINGLQAWIVTHSLFILGTWCGLLNPSWVVEKWLAIFYVANLLGYGLTFFAYLKAYLFPTYPKDNKYTGYPDYDMIMGVEFNPRMLGVDLKLFLNGRPGIILWSLVNLCFAYYQYETFGTVTNSMVLLNILQGLYVLDFFWNERWYLKTIDISHEHFGFYLAWGDCVWLPFMYTLQGCYLAHNPVVLNDTIFVLILVLGVLGYVIFRWANYQKDHFRRMISTGVAPIVWGKRASYICCNYHTADGKERLSYLLISGFWGMARHMNYVGDILLSSMWCFSCGLTHLLPHFYTFYIIALLVTRTSRDETRCRQKYGNEVWDDYCQNVPYRFIPYVY